MTKKVDLAKAQILVADDDRMITEILKATLNRMGLMNVQVTHSGRTALDILKSKEVDILITEWEMHPLDGISLVKMLRQSEDARYALMPVVMLTARAQMPDVIEARDRGVTEFLVKPFTAKTLYNRLEHIIDFPRDFLITDAYVGPDRRRIRKTLKQNNLEEDRRVLVPVVQAETHKMPTASKNQPRRIMPGYAIKKKIGLVDALNDVITEEKLQSAQQVISEFQGESLTWITEDLQNLEVSIATLKKGAYNEALEAAKKSLLSIKSRTGMFDYLLAAEVAFAFYGFLRNHFEAEKPNHATIMQKHLDVLKIILARQVTGNGNEVERELAEGLKMLTFKLQEA